MRIIIETIEHKDQRYDTVGDWQFIGDDLVIKVSKLGDEQMEFLVGLHELVEAYLCKAFGISESLVDSFDKANPDSPEPGALPGSPYYRQHFLATIVERTVANELDVNWDDYEAVIETMSQ